MFLESRVHVGDKVHVSDTDYMPKVCNEAYAFGKVVYKDPKGRWFLIESDYGQGVKLRKSCFMIRDSKLGRLIRESDMCPKRQEVNGDY